MPALGRDPGPPVTTAARKNLFRSAPFPRGNPGSFRAIARDVGYWEKNLFTGKIILSRAIKRMFCLQPGESKNWDLEKFLDRMHIEDRDTVRRV